MDFARRTTLITAENLRTRPARNYLGAGSVISEGCGSVLVKVFATLQFVLASGESFFSELGGAQVFGLGVSPPWIDAISEPVLVGGGWVMTAGAFVPF